MKRKKHLDEVKTEDAVRRVEGACHPSGTYARSLVGSKISWRQHTVQTIDSEIILNNNYKFIKFRFKIEKNGF